MTKSGTVVSTSGIGSLAALDRRSRWSKYGRACIVSASR